MFELKNENIVSEIHKISDADVQNFIETKSDVIKYLIALQYVDSMAMSTDGWEADIAALMNIDYNLED